MTGDRTAHPLLISLANIKMDIRMKSSHHAFMLLALLPVSKLIHKDKKMRGVLQARLTHECLDFILKPLKTAASIGVMMSDPVGFLRYCFTPLAAYIVDTPEALMLAGVGGKTSPVTMAMYKEFGDPFQHQPRTASITLAQLRLIESKVDPWADLVAYVREAKKIRLNGVHQPFWRDWPLAEPSRFLTPEPLHHFHRQFWDHDVKWCVNVLGDAEIDFRFSLVQPLTGYRYFKEGISKLKQVTGRDHRDIQRVIVGIIAGAAPNDFVRAIRALLDFRYLAQAPILDETTCQKILDALQEFHDHKAAILTAGARVGKGNKVIENWHIPKLELMQSVVPNIYANGATFQWSADVTEHAHITEIKQPARAGNNQNYDAQICRHLDRSNKCRQFDLATAIREARIQFGHGTVIADPEGDEEELDYVNTTSSLLTMINPVSTIDYDPISSNYFEVAESLKHDANPLVLHPLRTFAVGSIAFHLTRDPDFSYMSIDDAAELYQLPDLRSSLAEYLHRNKTGQFPVIGGRRTALPSYELPFQSIQVWCRIRIQSRSFHCPQDILPAQTVNACPPTTEWPLGRYDAVVVSAKPDVPWPSSALTGKLVLIQLYIEI